MPYVYLTAAVALSVLAIFAPVPTPAGLESVSPALMIAMALVLFYKSFSRTRARAGV